jgi:hypothetical protein
MSDTLTTIARDATDPAPPATDRADPFAAEVRRVLTEIWAKQAFRREADRAEGMTRLAARYDLDARVAALAGLRDQLVTGDREALNHATWRIVPFLDGACRFTLINALVLAASAA